jgi:hypothetical protein
MPPFAASTTLGEIICHETLNAITPIVDQAGQIIDNHF